MRRPEEALMTDASARPTPAKFAAWLCLGLFVLGIDQATKIWFEQNFSLGEVLPVCTGFNLVLAHNTGAAFSFLADAGGWQRWAFAALAAAVIVAMIVLLVRNSHRKLLSLSLTLIACAREHDRPHRLRLRRRLSRLLLAGLALARLQRR